MEIVFIRHSITAGNEERRFNGITDDPLSEAGIELAEQRTDLMPEVERIYVSPLTRCRQTAEILWPDVEKTVVEGLREMDFGPFEGKNHEELQGDPQYDAWALGEIEVPGLETLEECAARTITALRSVVEDAQGLDKIAVVSHGGAIASILQKHGWPERTSFYDWVFKNCSGCVMEVQRDPFLLRTVEMLGDNADWETTRYDCSGDL